MCHTSLLLIGRLDQGSRLFLVLGEGGGEREILPESRQKVFFSQTFFSGEILQKNYLVFRKTW
jgi:hypothetical protein